MKSNTYDKRERNLVDDPLLDKGEFRKRLGSMSEPTLYRLIQRGELPKPIKIGTRSFWRAGWAEDFIARQESAR